MCLYFGDTGVHGLHQAIHLVICLLSHKKEPNRPSLQPKIYQDGGPVRKFPGGEYDAFIHYRVCIAKYLAPSEVGTNIYASRSALL